MKPRPLIETNPYLKDPAMMHKLVARSVKTSCGVEGIRINKNVPQITIANRKKKKIYQSDR